MFPDPRSQISWGGSDRADDEERARLREQRDNAVMFRERRRFLQDRAPDEVRHTGADRGMHHAATELPSLVNQPRCNCGCELAALLDDSSPEPFDVLARMAIDPIAQAERQAEVRQMSYEKARGRLDDPADVHEGHAALKFLSEHYGLPIGGVGHEPGWSA
jgi:hypothetical protein